jgi:GntR family transcriptional regulator
MLKRGRPQRDPSARSAADAGEDASPVGFRPLYRQVRDALIKRIVEGAWQPGELLPSEHELAATMNVSQGTMRKALGELERDNFVIRRQGKGTFVARHDEARILFQFFRVAPDEGDSEFPDSRIVSTATRLANVEDAVTLKMRPTSRVAVIERLRSIGNRPCIIERIILPCSLFPRIEKRRLPNNLYQLYRSDFGVTIVRAKEKLKAVLATSHDGQLLGMKAGAPLLSIDRVGLTAEGRPVERRVSMCRTDIFHYFAELK